MHVVLAGPRHRGWHRRETVDNLALIRKVLDPRKEAHKDTLSVVSIGCDTGFGKDVKSYCEENGIKFLEIVIYFNGPRSKAEFRKAYMARHAALLDIGDEFHICVSPSRQSDMEELLEQVIAIAKKSYYVYDQQNEVIEFQQIP